MFLLLLFGVTFDNFNYQPIGDMPQEVVVTFTGDTIRVEGDFTDHIDPGGSSAHFSYDVIGYWTGEYTQRVDARFEGDGAGYITTDGYLALRVNGITDASEPVSVGSFDSDVYILISNLGGDPVMTSWERTYHVPEPGCLVLVIIGVLLLPRRRIK